ncbi:hypothetical protein [Flavobacterium sp. F52]|uniref:hypothetical protein n=1 Tax=Flavobacterium sp. F52 TaxID=1202532 RepID=UPI000272FA02|nr:hypothetical protein [Flavobacterium sp. F52]EJG02894.1 hypothetical protein FF52_01840 [Flavobacterium sp. F52]
MKFYILFFSCLFISCNKKEKVEITDSTNSASYFREKLYDKKLMDSLDNLALNKGDTIAYNKLKGIYFIGEQKNTGFLYHALIMSNKFNYKTASFDVYDILASNNEILDSQTKEIASRYLQKSKK